MSGLELSTYCGLLNGYYDLLATGQEHKAEALAEQMDLHWDNLTEEERETASLHAHQLAERYMS